MGIKNYIRINKKILIDTLYCLENFNSENKDIQLLVKQMINTLKQYDSKSI
jgi:hypothetical protein